MKTAIEKWLLALGLGLAMLISATVALATTQPPRVVDVGIYLNNVPQVNLKEKLFQADFYLWFRWQGDDLNPMESFEIVNGSVDAKEGLVTKKIGNTHYAAARISATIHRNFNVSRFPLDNQPLKIQIEETSSSSGEVVFRADKQSSGFSPKIDVPGWRTASFEDYVSVTTYPTNYGDISLPATKSQYPRYTFKINLMRAGWGNFIKLFSILFLAAGLAFCAFRIQSESIDARIALAASAVFMAVLTQSALSTSLPESDAFGMADQLYNTTMAYIVITFLAIIHTFRMQLAGNDSGADRVSCITGWVLSVSYTAACALIVAFA